MPAKLLPGSYTLYNNEAIKIYYKLGKIWFIGVAKTVLFRIFLMIRKSMFLVAPINFWSVLKFVNNLLIFFSIACRRTGD